MSMRFTPSSTARRRTRRASRGRRASRRIPGPHDAHRAEPQAIHSQVAADPNGGEHEVSPTGGRVPRRPRRGTGPGRVHPGQPGGGRLPWLERLRSRAYAVAGSPPWEPRAGRGPTSPCTGARRLAWPLGSVRTGASRGRTAAADVGERRCPRHPSHPARASPSSVSSPVFALADIVRRRGGVASVSACGSGPSLHVALPPDSPSFSGALAALG